MRHTMEERYVIVWAQPSCSISADAEERRGDWRSTQHAAILDAVDLFWRDRRVDRVDLLCETTLISTLRRDDARISATLAALEHAVREISEEESA
jgi:hypothetical protein